MRSAEKDEGMLVILNESCQAKMNSCELFPADKVQ
jgi:hypothetical protein